MIGFSDCRQLQSTARVGLRRRVLLPECCHE